ncbi:MULTISPECIES: ABC transporter permease [Dietzia]|jgi:ABC transporter DrrB family efflux protein|uniref:Transport permease protein n=1 Tax=Dietzia maris TaxID=37915 RepID=A0ABT8H109_9ACTN|nr:MULTISPECIES: ABC transporter permease [Dietzia]MBB0994566.1 ABC transporter permease [Dietzia sp. SLG510A3-40A3]MBB1009889.1 ABC transporter permease [Dietzia sp. SLG510A3-3B2-2]MBB1018160.1 ABC transporter permease [Dietzia sp. DQ11-71]MDJ0422283.1 ABC transporter permease [Dietzia kunjamensis]MDN4506142.1 ABC transporter permease [Dietzia maris]
MSTVADPATTSPERERFSVPVRPDGPSFGRQISALVRRNLFHIRRQPENLADVTIQPVMFVLLFAFVFGGAIAVAGSGDYREWLLPGIMAQTMAFSSFVVASGLCNDLNKGIIDRFRTLPIQRSSILIARSASSLIHSSIGVVVMSLTGLIVGWRIRSGLLDALLGYLILLGFGFVMIWIGIVVGSRLKTIEAVNGVMFTTTFPITFVANTFAPPESMPVWLRAIAEWNPLSSVVQAMRELWGNAPAVGPDAALPLQHPVLASLLWIVGLTVVIAPIAIKAFDARTRD